MALPSRSTWVLEGDLEEKISRRDGNWVGLEGSPPL
jgi:hypothetical protein